MKELVKGFMKWLIIVLATLCIITWTAAVMRCQGKQIVAPPYINHEEHKDVEDMEEDIRFKSIFVIATEPRNIFWKKESKDIVSTGSFSYDDRSRGVKDIQKGCYIAIYCTTHNYLYALYPCKEVFK